MDSIRDLLLDTKSNKKIKTNVIVMLAKCHKSQPASVVKILSDYRERDPSFIAELLVKLKEIPEYRDYLKSYDSSHESRSDTFHNRSNDMDRIGGKEEKVDGKKDELLQIDNDLNRGKLLNSVTRCNDKLIGKKDEYLQMNRIIEKNNNKTSVKRLRETTPNLYNGNLKTNLSNNNRGQFIRDSKLDQSSLLKGKNLSSSFIDNKINRLNQQNKNLSAGFSSPGDKSNILYSSFDSKIKSINLSNMPLPIELLFYKKENTVNSNKTLYKTKMGDADRSWKDSTNAPDVKRRALNRDEGYSSKRKYNQEDSDEDKYRTTADREEQKIAKYNSRNEVFQGYNTQKDLAGDTQINTKLKYEARQAGKAETAIDIISILMYKLQCNICGLRFKEDEDGKSRLGNHIEDHSRRSRSVESSTSISREYFSSYEMFISNLSVYEVEIPENDDVKENLAYKAENAVCDVCKEKIGIEWSDEADDWILTDCILVDEDEKKYCHRMCII